MTDRKMNLLVTLNEAYLPHLNVMLTSLLQSNPGVTFEIYLLQSSVRDSALDATRALLGDCGRIHSVFADESRLADAPTTDRYPTEIYYRIFAATYLPQELDRVLYLDPDIIVNGDLYELYTMEMGDSLFAAASHIKKLMHKVNELRIDLDESSPYINSGVMLMNLAQLRREQNFQEVFDFIQTHRATLVLPDQDIISGLYGTRILSLDPYRYNMTERLFLLHSYGEKEITLDWVREHSAIIHYCGRNKPWKSSYFGRLDVFYLEASEACEKRLAKQ